MERKRLEDFASATPSRWRENAIYRLENSRWLRRSQKIAMEMLDRMDFLGVNQKELAHRMGCTPQYVSKILKGKENLSLETISKIEEALDMEFQSVPVPVAASLP
ncbi:MAG: helix-turn-helix transcriptional regulator [Muribaculaceae bacterium]|nr:helix-turn-helix transcriptional regulator [Muribaculaceae bacterium]